MVSTPHVHDLILLRTEWAFISVQGDSACRYLNPNQRPWVVVRRASVSNGLIPIGVRGPQRYERCAGFTRLSEVVETQRPDQLRLRLAENSRRGLQAFRTLSYLESHLAGLDMTWGPGGSVGYELASGTPAVRADSDLDFVLFAPRQFDIAEAQDLWRIISGAPRKVDALVETPCCGFSLEEFATNLHRKILLRTSEGRVLGSAPWNLQNGESN